MNIYKATTLATLMAIAAHAYAKSVPVTSEPVVGAQVHILQNGTPTTPTQSVLYEKGTPQTLDLRVDGFAFERYGNKPHPVAGHALEVCIYPETAYSDKQLSPQERLMCHTLPSVTFRNGPTAINSTFSNGTELHSNQVEYPQTVFVNQQTNAKPNLPVGSYLLVTSGEIDGNPVGRDQMYAAHFKVLDAAPKPVEVKNIFADRGMKLAYARHEPQPGTHITLQGDNNNTVPVLFVPHKWDVAFLPTLEEWEVKGMKYREEYLLMDGAANDNKISLVGIVDSQDSQIVHYSPGQSQEFRFVGEFPASSWNTFWRGGDAGISSAVVTPAQQYTTQPIDLNQVIQMMSVDNHGRPTWNNVGTLLHVAYDNQNNIIGWQQAYIVTTPQVNSAAGPLILGMAIGAGGMALINYLPSTPPVIEPTVGTGVFGDVGTTVK